MKPKSRDLRPGQWIRCRDHRSQEIRERKADGSGWWLTDSSGIADYAFDGSADWDAYEQVEPAKWQTYELLDQPMDADTQNWMLRRALLAGNPELHDLNENDPGFGDAIGQLARILPVRVGELADQARQRQRKTKP